MIGYSPYDKRFEDSPLYITDFGHKGYRDIAIGRGNMLFWKIRATPELDFKIINQEDGEMTVKFFLTNYQSFDKTASGGEN